MMLALPDSVHILMLSEKHDIWCLVDAADYPWLSQWRWNYGWWANTPHKRYAKRNIGAARSTIYLHREVMKRHEPHDESFQSLHLVDHVNGQSLDNRRANLRWSTVSQNNANRIPWRQVPSLGKIVHALRQARESEPVPF